MTKKFIAIAPIGTEFLFRRSSAIAIPTASAEKIAKALNNAKYQIKQGETWHIYDNDAYMDEYIERQIKSYKAGRNIKVSYYHG